MRHYEPKQILTLLEQVYITYLWFDRLAINKYHSYLVINY